MSKFKSIINSEVPVLIDFYADWCGPCRVLSPEVQKAAKLLGNTAKVLKINVDKNPAVSQAYRIQSIPTLMIFKNGQLLWRKSGTMSAHQISETVKKFI
ncbi:MAG: thioredoxin [Bacteroidota bacterium]|jgi:thioredoxin 1